MRWLLLSMVLVVGMAQSLDAKPDQNEKKTSKGKHGTQNNPIVVKVLPSLSDEHRAAQEKQHEDNEARTTTATENLVKETNRLVLVTSVLAAFTALLFGATVWLARDARRTSDRQAGETQESLGLSRTAANAAKDSADAAVKAVMPVLAPLIISWEGIHPLDASDTPITYDANVHFVFENYGKTPGIIRQVRADLFLTEMDQFPLVDFEKLTLLNYQVLVPGDTRGQTALTAAVDYKRAITLNPTELSELLAEATGRYRRFALIGQVIYDDFFDTRHTRRFCIKIRFARGINFQMAQGGVAYNNFTSQKIPKNDLS